MKKLLSLFLLAVCLIACKSNANIKAETQSEQNETVNDEWVITEPAIQDPISIAFGDFDGMFEFSKKCQNGDYADGQTVTIDGEFNISPMGSISIGQRDKAKGEYFGTMLVVNGWTEDNYPPDESRVKVKAKLKRNEQFWFLYLVAEPEDVESVE